MAKKLLNASEMGKKGQKAFVEKYGTQVFSELGKKGAASKLKNDPDYFKKLARISVEKRKERKVQEEEDKKPLNRVIKALIGED